MHRVTTANLPSLPLPPLVSRSSLRAAAPRAQLTYHNLQAIFQHLHLLKGGGTGVGAGGGAGAAAGGGGMPGQPGGYGGGYGAPAAGGWQQQQQPPAMQQPGGYGGGPAAGGGGGGMEPCTAAVMQIISEPTPDGQGVHVNDVRARV